MTPKIDACIAMGYIHCTHINRDVRDLPGINQHRRQSYEESSLVMGRICLKLGFKPNTLTALSLICAIISGICFWKADLWWAVFWMLATALTDVLDGATARAGNIGTVFGGILDRVSDRYSEFFILAGITLSGTVHPGWGLFALFGMLIASYTRATAESLGRIENCAVGIMGRPEKFILIIIGSVIEIYLPSGKWPGGGWLEFALIVVGVTSLITAIQRLIYTKKILGNKREV